MSANCAHHVPHKAVDSAKKWSKCFNDRPPGSSHYEIIVHIKIFYRLTGGLVFTATATHSFPNDLYLFLKPFQMKYLGLLQ